MYTLCKSIPENAPSKKPQKHVHITYITEFNWPDFASFLGTEDTNTEDKNLRKTREANLQGPHRLARGQMYVEKHKEMAASLGIEAGLGSVQSGKTS